MADVLSPVVRDFLASHGFKANTDIAPLGGGGRHRVFAVGDGSRKAALKVYEPPGHGRDAFGREMAVHDLLAAHVPQHVPPVLGRDASARCVLFGWVEGRKLCAAEIDAAAARGMAVFAAAINAPDIRAAARRMALPAASDAAFSIAGHRRIARARLDALRSVRPEGPAANDLEDFVANSLLPALDELEGGSRLDDELADDGWRISPSDFGFHNVIVRPAGGFCFIDFEHAGWDDPAKMAADFILQPECMLDDATAGAFLAQMDSSGVFPGALRERVHELLPVQAIKWTSIVLNVFHRPGQPHEVLQSRLVKARSYWLDAGSRLPTLIPRS